MNCKPGDLAIIVSAKFDYDQKHVGKVVRIVSESIEWPGSWETDPECIRPSGQAMSWADHRLCPIRDSDGEDEMLRIVGKPQEVTA